jgi:hypothetical protein
VPQTPLRDGGAGRGTCVRYAVPQTPLRDGGAGRGTCVRYAVPQTPLRDGGAGGARRPPIKIKYLTK